MYSTNQDFGYTTQQTEGEDAIPPSQQSLKVSLDKSGRAGKKVTLVTGFVGSSDDLNSLTKVLKTKCGVGGSAKDNEILIQGDLRDKVVNLLVKEGYKAKRIG